MVVSIDPVEIITSLALMYQSLCLGINLDLDFQYGLLFFQTLPSYYDRNIQKLEIYSFIITLGIDFS